MLYPTKCSLNTRGESLTHQIKQMKFFNAIAAAAAVVTCSLCSELPAKANMSSINSFCSSVLELSKTAGSAAPGSAAGQIMSRKDYNGYTYTQLWNVAKSVGTSPDCKRMY